VTGIYQAGKLEPAAPIGGRVMLLDHGGPLAGQSKTFVMGVTFVEPIFGPGPHGTVLLWSQSSTPPAGYGSSLPGGATSGSIASGATITSAPTIMSQARFTLLQFRWMVKVIGTLPGSWVIDDLDVTLGLPAATPRGQLLNGQSKWNSRFQPVESSDTAQAPSQGANQSNPANATLFSAADWANLTEAYIYEQDYLPQWTLINNGSVSMNTAMAVSVDVFGFRLDLEPIDTPEAYWVPRRYMRRDILLPPDLVYIPITGRSTAAQTQPVV